MLHRRHCLSDIVTANNVVQKVDDEGPSRKKRKLSPVVEAPKVSTIGDRLVCPNPTEPQSSTSHQPTSHLQVPESSHYASHRSQHSLRTHRNSSSRRADSLRGLRSDVVNQHAHQPNTASMVNQNVAYPTRVTAHTHTQPGSDLHQSVMSSATPESVHYLTSQLGRPAVIPASFFVSPLSPAVTPADMGCYLAVPPCISAVPLSDPYLTNVRPCPPWSPFSAVGIVPAPVLATEAIPGYHSINHRLSFAPPSAAYNQNTMATAPVPQPTAPSISRPTAGVVPETGYVMPQSSTSEPASQTGPRHTMRAPPPYPLAASRHHHSSEGVQRRSQQFPNVSRYTPYGHNRDTPWTPSQPSENSPPLFIQHFLTMLENSLVQEPAYHHPYSSPNFHNYEALLGLARQLSETKPRGMSKADIDRLPLYLYSNNGATSSETKTDDTQTMCVVCMSEFVSRQRVRELPCQHIFHSKCIDKWLKTNRTCPLCRCDSLNLLNSDDKDSVE